MSSGKVLFPVDAKWVAAARNRRPVMDKVQPGDIIAFRTRDCLALGIQACSLGSFSHVGIIAELPGAGLVLWESTTTCRRSCLIGRKVVFGVQCHGLYSRILDYQRQHGRVWHYPLRTPLSDSKSTLLSTFLVRQAGLPYDTVGACRARSLLGGWLLHLLPESWWWLPGREHLESWFCSELTAACHRELGLLDTQNVSAWNPSWFVRYQTWKKVFATPTQLLGD